MYCASCNAKNNNKAKYCYKCGKKLQNREFSRINSNQYVVKKVSLKKFIFDNIILSKNKYRNVFILLSSIVLCLALSVPVLKGIPESFNKAMLLVNFASGNLAKEILKSQTELFFRDVFVRIILILLFWSNIIFNLIILFYAYILKRNFIKFNNFYKK